MNKDKILAYLNFKIEVLEKENLYNKNLDDDCISKDKFIKSTLRELRAYKEIKAFIESELAAE